MMSPYDADDRWDDEPDEEAADEAADSPYGARCLAATAALAEHHARLTRVDNPQVHDLMTRMAETARRVLHSLYGHADGAGGAEAADAVWMQRGASWTPFRAY
jgi:hypothetical protein